MEKIVFVDGFAIRNSLDVDFTALHRHSTNIGSYSPKFYIPEGEVWIDQILKDEADFLMAVDAFIDPAAKGLSYEELRDEARIKFRTEGDMPEHVVRSEEREGITVRYIDGKIVRNYLDPEFVMGGHDLVYDYIPDGEIWIDAKVDPVEALFVLCHEIVERDHMKKGKSYEVAHEHGSVVEREMRRKVGEAHYPGDDEYTWFADSNETIIKEHYAKE